MILDRYLLREIVKPLAIICGILVLIFASFNWIRYLGRAVEAQLPTSMIFTLIMLKLIIALEVLLPVALLLSVVLGLGRLHAELEMTALSACGIGPFKVVKIVFLLALGLAVIVSSLSLFLRPWAYQQSYTLEAEAENAFSVSTLEAGRFYERERDDGTLIIFVQQIDRKNGRMKHVFIQSEKDQKIRILSAKEAYERRDPTSGRTLPILVNGYEYKLSRQKEVDRITQFKELTIYPDDITPYYTRKARPTFRMRNSSNPKEIAEFQWRLSTGLSTILLALLGVPLSRATPRHGKYAKIFVAVIAFAIYYNLGAVAKAWVEQGVVNPIPGIWWVNGLLAIILLVLYVPEISITRMRQP